MAIWVTTGSVAGQDNFKAVAAQSEAANPVGALGAVVAEASSDCPLFPPAMSWAITT